jgi:hypothetical protein
LIPLILDADSGKTFLWLACLSAGAATAGGKGGMIKRIQVLTCEDPTPATSR